MDLLRKVRDTASRASTFAVPLSRRHGTTTPRFSGCRGPDAVRQFRSFTHMAQPQRKPDHTLAPRGARGADQVSAHGAERLTEGPQQVRTHAVGQVVVLEVAGPLNDVIEEFDRAIQLALADGPPGRRPPRGSPSRPSIAIAAAHVNVDLAYTTFGGVRLVIATDDLRGARAALG